SVGLPRLEELPGGCCVRRLPGPQSQGWCDPRGLDLREWHQPAGFSSRIAKQRERVPRTRNRKTKGSIIPRGGGKTAGPRLAVLVHSRRETAGRVLPRQGVVGVD